jgi:glutamate synthase (NADPH/NADH)
MEEVPDSQKFFPAQLVFLALGFLGPQSEILQALGVKQDARSNVQTPAKVCLCLLWWMPRCLTRFYFIQKYSTNVKGVFAAGDCRRGQSLIVWGIKYVP